MTNVKVTTVVTSKPNLVLICGEKTPSVVGYGEGLRTGAGQDGFLEEAGLRLELGNEEVSMGCRRAQSSQSRRQGPRRQRRWDPWIGGLVLIDSAARLVLNSHFLWVKMKMYFHHQ